MLHAVIMAGGGGTRFWPRSRVKRPKQFLTLTGERSLLQMAYDRVEAQAAPANTWVLTTAAHSEQVREQLPELPAGQVVGEPCGRDTAACIGLGAALIARRDPGAVMIVTPADHVIEPVPLFRQATHVAAQMAREHPAALVTMGVVPTFPATGYGYIHRGEELAHRQGLTVHRVRKFKEKPKPDVAEEYVASGEFFWNSGIFVWRAVTILNALAKNQPALNDAVCRIADAWGTPRQDEVFRKEYEGLGKISIDHAVMEHAEEVLVVQAPFRWDDVGSWLALERMHPQDADGNTVLARHCGIRTEECVIVADGGTLVATIGVDNLLIIQDGDAILVADRREESAVKEIVERLKQQGLVGYL